MFDLVEIWKTIVLFLEFYSNECRIYRLHETKNVQSSKITKISLGINELSPRIQDKNN